MDIDSRETGDRIWAAGDLTNKRFEGNHEKQYGVKPAYIKVHELQGLVTNDKERPSSRNVP